MPVDIKRIVKALLFVLETAEDPEIINANELTATLRHHTKVVMDRKAERSVEIKGYNEPELYSEELEDLKTEDTTDDTILETITEISTYLPNQAI